MKKNSYYIVTILKINLQISGVDVENHLFYDKKKAVDYLKGCKEYHKKELENVVLSYDDNENGYVIYGELKGTGISNTNIVTIRETELIK